MCRARNTAISLNHRGRATFGVGFCPKTNSSPTPTPNTKFTKGIFGLQNDFGDDFGDRKNVDPPMSDEYVAHFGSVDAELSGPRMFGPPMSDEYVAPLGQSKPGPGY